MGERSGPRKYMYANTGGGREVGRNGIHNPGDYVRQRHVSVEGEERLILNPGHGMKTTPPWQSMESFNCNPKL